MEQYRFISTILLSFILITNSCIFGAANRCEVTGEMRKWYNVTLTFTGPETSEDAQPNPFRD